MVFEENWSVTEFLSSYGYELGDAIGTGAFGSVWKLRTKANRKEWAAKVINLDRLNATERSMVEEEVATLTSIRHPHIVEVSEVLRTRNLIIIVMEYLRGGDLFDRLSIRLMSESQVVDIASQILSAVAFLHERGIAHRDLKLENVVFATTPSSEKQVVKIIDFGYARKFKRDERATQKCGTESYMSPQVVTMTQYNPFSVDIWSIGVILYALVTGRFPFFGKDLEKSIVHSPPSFHESQWRECSQEFTSILLRLLSKSEDGRLEAEQAAKCFEELRYIHSARVRSRRPAQKLSDSATKYKFDVTCSATPKIAV
uniref:Protein kinase domain-containing protein n=1 Tax=Compsopogon caeruleus TaxID=31354 RepID=A0A7S1T543_9RHOD|mmetsp:Transcript_10692/g.21511  ORF Transcript_10692/g.21511 Transcript_10692/m.21511 type:complete len:314 (+) Transcript_10692:61-1002(+)